MEVYGDAIEGEGAGVVLKPDHDATNKCKCHPIEIDVVVLALASVRRVFCRQPMLKWDVAAWLVDCRDCER